MKTLKPIPSEDSPVTYLTPAERSAHIKQDIRKATEKRLMQEIIRPKFIIGNSYSDSFRYPQLSLNQPKLDRIKLFESRSSDTVAPSLPPAKFLSQKLQGKRLKSHPFAKSSYTSCIPEWLSSMPDFHDVYSALKIKQNPDLGQVCQTVPSKRTEAEKEVLLHWIQSIAFFKSMPKVVITETCDRLYTVQFKQGDRIIKLGDTADCMYIVYKGELDILINHQVIAEKLPGDVVGETALDNNRPRNSDVYARTDAIVFKLKSSDYKNVIFQLKKLDKQKNTEFLFTVKFFSGWSYAKLRRVSSLMSENVYEAGQSNV